jgi:hypothetical protein
MGWSSKPVADGLIKKFAGRDLEGNKYYEYPIKGESTASLTYTPHYQASTNSDVFHSADQELGRRST